MVNFTRFACALAIAGLASSQSVSSTDKAGLATQTSQASVSLPLSSQTGSPVQAPKQSGSSQPQTSVGPPVSQTTPTGTPTRRETGIGRPLSSVASSASASASASANLSVVSPSGPLPTAAPSGIPTDAPTDDISVLKFSKLPPDFDSED